MAVAYFNQDGKCVCIAKQASRVAGLSDDIPYAAVIAEDNVNDIFYNIEDDTVNLKSAFNIIVDGDTIRNIPANTTVFVEGESYVVNDGSLTVEGNLSALVSVFLQHPRYKDITVEVRT
jgi:hypothetical protein